MGPKVPDLTYKSRAKWKMLRGIYSAIYGEVKVSLCVEIKGDYNEKLANLFYFCHFKKLVRPETFGPTLVHRCGWFGGVAAYMQPYPKFPA
jgi:hypothetical protein